MQKDFIYLGLKFSKIVSFGKSFQKYSRLRNATVWTTSKSLNEILFSI